MKIYDADKLVARLLALAFAISGLTCLLIPWAQNFSSTMDILAAWIAGGLLLLGAYALLTYKTKKGWH